MDQLAGWELGVDHLARLGLGGLNCMYKVCIDVMV